MAFQLHNGMGSAFFTTNTWGNGNSNNSGTGTGNSGSRSRPGTSSGEQRDRDSAQTQTQSQQQQQKNSNATTTSSSNTPNVLTKDRERKPSFGRRPSFTSPSRSKRRSSVGGGEHRSHHIKTHASTPPALPDFALVQAAAARLAKETEAVVISPTTTNPTEKPTTTSSNNNSNSGRNAPTPLSAMNGHYSAATSPPTIQTGPGLANESSSFSVHQHIHELANKRISTLDYLRKAYVTQLALFIARSFLSLCDAIPVALATFFCISIVFCIPIIPIPIPTTSPHSPFRGYTYINTYDDMPINPIPVQSITNPQFSLPTYLLTYLLTHLLTYLT